MIRPPISTVQNLCVIDSQNEFLVEIDIEDVTHRMMCNRLRLILPEGTAIGFRLSHASREGSALGALLSNTRTICPWVGDNLGKLRIIPHRSPLLECLVVESSGAQG